MRSIAALIVAVAGLAFGATALAQPWGQEPKPGLRGERKPQSTPPPAQPQRPFAAEPKRSARSAERCDNFRRELRQARRQEREAITTGQGNQLSLRRQQIEEARQRAGC